MRINKETQAIVDALDYDVESFVSGYLECAIWLAEDGSRVGRSMGVSSITREAMSEIVRHCCEFISANLADLELFKNETGRDESYCGHDFYLTERGHGLGFWDRGAGEAGGRLTKSSGYTHLDLYSSGRWIYFG